MKTFQIKLLTMCVDGVGIFVWAAALGESPFEESPAAFFTSLSNLSVACEHVGIPCLEWGAPDHMVQHRLSAEQLHSLGFALKEPYLDVDALIAA